jgi:peptidyl-prolyl cis-trans isomerase C
MIVPSTSPFRSRAIALLAAPFCIALALSGPVRAQSNAAKPDAAKSAAAKSVAGKGDKVVARVDGMPITEKDLDIAAEDLGDRLPGVGEAQKRDYLIGYAIDLKVGAKAAAEAKVGDSPDFAPRLAYFRDKVMLDEYLSREVKKAVTPDAARKLYDETVKDLKPELEVRARHILVETEDEAKKVYDRIKAGEDFAKLAGTLSKDPGSGSEGGDLGFFTKDRMVPEFAEAAFKLEPGQVSEPVKTQFGWHIIKTEEKRTKPLPTFDEVKDQLDSYLTRKAQQDIVLALRAKAKIERLDEPRKPEAPANPEAPAKPEEPKKP